MGEQIHVACWPAISAITHDPVSRIFDSISEAAAKHHALAGQTFVINVQPCVDEDTVNRLGFGGHPEMLRVGGGWSAIVGPNGQIIAGPVRDEETILYADIDLADIVIMKQPCDSAGHYARPDVFSFGLLPPIASHVQTDQIPSEGVSSDKASPALAQVDP
jgi:nitrilase